MLSIMIYEIRKSSTWFMQTSVSKIQGLLKDFLILSFSFQGLEVYEKSLFKC